MEEEKVQNAKMEFQPLSFAGNTNTETESSYMGISLQQTPQTCVDFLSQSGLSQIQNQMVFNDKGITVNDLTCLVKNQEQESIDGFCGRIFESRSTKATSARRRLPSRVRSDVAKQKAREADRRRRAIISGRLDALQELLPYSKEGSKADRLDDFIEYVKYLQFQVKGLSCSRLGDESTSSPWIFLQGYGHYLLQECLVNEPLEETMGKLLEQNPWAAIQLFQSRGLHVMPMALAEGLSQGI